MLGVKSFERFIAQRLALGKHKTFSRFIVRIAMTSVALSIAVMIIAISLVRGFSNEVSRKVYDFWAHVHVSAYSFTDAYTSDPITYDELVQDAIQMPGVEHIQASITEGGIVKTKSEFDAILLKGVGEDFDLDRFGSYMTNGRFVSFSDTLAEDEIVVSEVTAKRLKLQLEDKVYLTFPSKDLRRLKPYVVVGTYNTGLEEYDKKFAFVNIQTLRILNEWDEDSVMNIEIFVKDIGDMADVGGDIYFSLNNPELEVQTIHELEPDIFNWLNLQHANGYFVLVVMIIVALMNSSTALLILILERTTMIGILKALGADNWSIQKVFLYNAAYIIGFGMLIGNAVGIGLCLLQQQFGFITLPEASYYVSVAPVDLNVWWIIGINVGSFVMCMLALFIPSNYVSSIKPVKAIRFE